VNYYQALDNAHVFIHNKDQINFWEQELYRKVDSEACIDVSLLLKERLYRIVKSDEEKNEE
jgi:hypothetical protein